MATYVPPKRATAFIFYVGLVSQANTKILQGTPTLAAGDFKVSIDGGALNNLATLPTVTPAASKMVKISLSIAEMTGDNITVVCSDATGAEWCDLVINIQTTARQIDDLAYPATTGRSMVVDAAGLVDATAVKLGPTGTGAAQTARDVGASVLVGDKTGFALADASSDAVIADAVWNALKASYGAANSYGELVETDLDATISSRSTYAGTAVASVTAPVTVGDYSTGKSPSEMVLATPANKLATDGSGQVTAAGVQGNVTGSVGSVGADVGITQAGADKAWTSAARTLTTVIGVAKNVELVGFEFLMRDSADHITPITGRTVTAERSIDGAAFAACANAVVEVGSGVYKITLAAADLNGNVITLKFTAAGADACYATIKTSG